MRYRRGHQWKEDCNRQEFQFENLTEMNQEVCRKLLNRAFINSPNGAILTVEEMEEVVREYKEKPHLAQLCLYDGEPAGLFELTCKAQVGWIDVLGVDPAFQGQGIGKVLLKRSVELLHQSDMEEVKLYVMSTNERAMKLYTKHGFELEKVSSIWFEKSC
ncbi:MAG: GNAT family N-acetyltransferase [Halanaerobiales bacterium]|nr:GNAT family N-acetyltransferase [Halanaerobiales bacterium]